MTSDIVQTDQSVTLVGAGPINMELLEIALTFAPFLVAVDGGAEMVRKCGKRANLLIGDLDSVSTSTRALYPSHETVHIAEQETTDLDKALSYIQAPLMVGLGFLGGRSDHHLSALRSVGLQSGGSTILLSDEDAVFRAPADLSLPLKRGTRVSIFPVGAAVVSAQGLAWPLANAHMSLDALVSQSNQMASHQLDLQTSGHVLIVVPRAFLPAIVKALGQARSGALNAR